jgi:plasmid stabilization system protein ParE
VTYRVIIQPPAGEDLDAACRWIARHSSGRAEAWLRGAFEAIDSLSVFPRRCPLAPEDSAFEEEIRQLLYGDFRILFTLNADTVRILHIRHGARRFMNPDEAV